MSEANPMRRKMDHSFGLSKLALRRVCEQVMAVDDLGEGVAVFKSAFEHFGELSKGVDLDTDEPLCSECSAVGWTP
eukprot:3215560-Pleurochrysis_carterae.AAC.1